METQNVITVDKRCQFIKENGERCEAKCCLGSPYCYFHHPSLSNERAVARRRGGLNRYARGEPGNYQIETPGDILAVLVDSLNQATALPNTAGRAKAIGYVASILLKTFELSDLHNRLRALEKRVLGEK
ncbi:MAG: hypothetical protein A2Y60_01855 [Chloroflexi bacterium RBG_13_54_9]|nr:MAG: hypothetical protein A2Y60_01855 [Chloroflexi bacterium RBG_13_54_9]